MNDVLVSCVTRSTRRTDLMRYTGIRTGERLSPDFCCGCNIISTWVGVSYSEAFKFNFCNLWSCAVFAGVGHHVAFVGVPTGSLDKDRDPLMWLDDSQADIENRSRVRRLRQSIHNGIHSNTDNQYKPRSRNKKYKIVRITIGHSTKNIGPDEGVGTFLGCGRVPAGRFTIALTETARDTPVWVCRGVVLFQGINKLLRDGSIYS